MAHYSDVRHVRCPRCHGLLQEPAGVPVYQCGGCGAALRAKNHSAGVGSGASTSSALPPPPSAYSGSDDVAAASTSRSATPRNPDAGDVASTSGSTPEDAATTGTRLRSQGANIASRRDDLIVSSSSARKDGYDDDVATSNTRDNDTSSGGRRQAPTGTTSRRHGRSAGDLAVPAIEKKKEHDDRSSPTTTTSRGGGGARESSDDFRRPRRATDNAVSSPGVGGVGGTKAAASGGALESQQVDDDSEKTRKTQAPRLPHAAPKKELAPKSPAQAAARDGGTSSPPPQSHRQAEQDLAPLRHKILKAVDDLKGDLSELFSKSPDLNPTMARRPPRLLPKQGDGAAVASAIPAPRARHEARAAVKPGRVAAAPPRRGLPSRRYRRCRADPPCCRDHAQPRMTTSHQHHGHGCCCQCHHHHHQGNTPPECGSCRGHCGRPRKAQQQEWKPPAAAAPPQRRRPPPPRNHCRPVLKGAPFIVCSSCFQLVQVPADFAVSTGRLRKLRCGACSTVLSYSYRDPGRKKPLYFSDGSVVDQRSQYCTDPFAPFLDGVGLSSYSTTEEDEQPPLHVSRNTSFDSVVKEGRLHRLMGYGSASELLRRRSPDLYESGCLDDYRTTPDYHRKGKAVCVDAEDDKDDSDDDDEDSGGPGMRSAARGAVWPMPGTIGKGPGAIRIKS